MVRLLGFGILLLSLPGCTNVMEHEILYSTGLNVFSSSDLSHLDEFSVSPQTRSFILRNGKLFTASTDGYVRCYDSETMELIAENLVGLPSPAGYNRMVFNPLRQTLYLIGSLGKILELSMPDCAVIDEFSACSSPVEIGITIGSPGYLWIVDGLQNSVYQVHLQTNLSCGSLSYPAHYAIQAIQPSIYEDSLLVGTSDGFFRLEAMGPGSFRSTWVSGLATPCMALDGIPGDSNFVTVLGYGSPVLGELCVYDDSIYINPPPKFYNEIPISGDFPMIAAESNGEYVYALTLHEEGNSVLYQCKIGEGYGITAQVNVAGNPFDIQVDNEGRVYVLTYE